MSKRLSNSKFVSGAHSSAMAENGSPVRACLNDGNEETNSENFPCSLLLRQLVIITPVLLWPSVGELLKDLTRVWVTKYSVTVKKEER